MKDDTISRQAAVKVCMKYNGHGSVWACIMDDIKQLPSSEPETNYSEIPNGWIPVTERLPEPRIDVWCNSDLGQMVGYYDETVETWYGRDYLELMVTAWMPLPEPYREEEQDATD